MSTVEPTLSTTNEWDRLWKVIRDVPDDFASWEQLIRITEEEGGGITKASSPENIARLETVYDNFLQKFPLCFGYWKKYADWELAIHGEQGAEKVSWIVYFKRMLLISNFIDI